MFRLFKNLTKKDLTMIFASVILIIAQVWLDLKLPGYMKQITENLVTTGGAKTIILNYGIKMLACALSVALLAIIVGFLIAKVSASFGTVLRTKVFDKVQGFSLAEINKFSTASLITRSTNDIIQVQNTVAMGLQVLIRAPIMAIWAIVEIVNKSWQWSIATSVAVMVILLLISIVTIFAIPRFKVIQKQTDDLNRVTRENILGTRVIRAYNAEEYEENRFDGVNSKLTNTHLFVSRIMALLSPGMNLVMSGLTLATYWIGVIIINNAGLIQKAGLFSDMMAYSQYATRVIMAFIMLALIFIILPRAIVSANRINEVLSTSETIKNGAGVNGKTKCGEIEFINVSFKYPDAEEYIIKDVSFKAKMGETIAFIGSTGSGKSTLINLIPRFYDTSEGQILIDGEDIKNYTLEQIHNIVGYISQNAILFSGTIESNLSVGADYKKQYSVEELDNVTKISQCYDFIKSKKEEYKSEVTQGGSNLSGGQKQRLSIARALLRNPEILIFDDSFSALDYKTDYSLRQSLKEKCGGVTKIFVAQRVGTIKDADNIIVLDNGCVVGSGKHDWLLDNCEVYKEIVLSQLSEEELK